MNVKLDMRLFADQEGDNPMSSTIASRDKSWCMSHDDYMILLEETKLQEDHCEYEIGEANASI